jgi:hypothetical protein
MKVEMRAGIIVAGGMGTVKVMAMVTVVGVTDAFRLIKF